ncbi:MAG TPA: aldo/keto reductase [Allosphingosinicella sp.]|nr:aldo/keto reductase [Allosphingosinicella sp.]
MIDRRTLLAGLAALPLAGPLLAETPITGARVRALRTARIPGANVDAPVIGIGTARRYADPQTPEQMTALKDTIARFVAAGGTVIDTAPSYGRAEEVVGQLVAELGLRDRLFLATKVGAATREEGAVQIAESFRKLRTDRLDLLAVHNLRDVDNQLGILKEMKAAGRIRAIGITTSNDQQYEAFEAVMRREPLDAIQVDYAIDNRNAAERILPLAREKNMAVMINLPFGRERLFAATRDRPLPDFAAAIGVTSWAQFFLKYVVSHPANPIAIPGMAQTRYVDDNLGAARDPVPDAAMRTRMEQVIDAL